MVVKNLKIFCPKCGRFVFSTSKKATVHIDAKCKKCNHRVVYNGKSGDITAEKLPERNTSSGLRYY